MQLAQAELVTKWLHRLSLCVLYQITQKNQLFFVNIKPFIKIFVIMHKKYLLYFTGAMDLIAAKRLWVQ